MNNTLAKELALYILRTKGTVRHTASMYGISKSSVHRHLTVTLKKVNGRLYRKVRKLLNQNKKEATKRATAASMQSTVNKKFSRTKAISRRTIKGKGFKIISTVIAIVLLPAYVMVTIYSKELLSTKIVLSVMALITYMAMWYTILYMNKGR